MVPAHPQPAVGDEGVHGGVHDAQRAADFNAAFADPVVRGIVCTRGGYGAQRMVDAIDERTLLVECSHVLFRTSTVVDLAPIVEKAHAVGALVVVDGYQAAGALPVDVVALGADVYLGGSVKYLSGGPGNGWMHAKLAIVLLLVGYHHGCGRLLRGFELGSNRRSHRWYRLFNEAPVLLLVGAVALVVVKPF